MFIDDHFLQPLLLLPHPQQPLVCFPVTKHLFAQSRIFYKRNDIVYSLRSGFFPQNHVVCIHPVCGNSSSFFIAKQCSIVWISIAHLFVHLFMDFGLFAVFCYCKQSFCKQQCKSLYGHIFAFLLCKYQRVEWLDYMVGVCLTFYKTAKLFFEVAVHFPSAVYESFIWSTFSLTLDVVGQSFHILALPGVCSAVIVALI